VDVDLRKLRYFVALAEEMHFGRAAQRLMIAQPVLSRQIRALEKELGAQLLRRDRRSTELTAAGKQLLQDALPLLTAAAGLQRRVALAAGGTRRFRIGFMPGITVSAAVRDLTRRHPGLAVEVVRTSWDDQTQVVLDGSVDVSLVRMPVDQSGLRLQPLFTEPRVVVLPAGHRLAAKDVLAVADLADEQLLQDPDAVPEWRDLPRPAGHRPRPRPRVRTVEEKLEYVASGAGLVVLPESTAAYYTRPDIAQVPLDVGPNQVCAAWRAGRDDELVRDFADIAVRTYTGHGTAG